MSDGTYCTKVELRYGEPINPGALERLRERLRAEIQSVMISQDHARLLGDVLGDLFSQPWGALASVQFRMGGSAAGLIVPVLEHIAGKFPDVPFEVCVSGDDQRDIWVRTFFRGRVLYEETPEDDIS